MDLLECAACDRRFLVANAEDRDWRCPHDGDRLRLVVRGLPGTPAQIEAALNARRLETPEPTDS